MASYARIREVRGIYDFPIIVLTRAIPGSDPSGVWPNVTYQIEVDIHREFLELSTNSKQVIAEQIEHEIQHYESELVIEAIREIVQSASL